MGSDWATQISEIEIAAIAAAGTAQLHKGRTVDCSSDLIVMGSE
ncbi:putative unusual protein kinase regulating ubiquinone biosynthesis (AarF/ABC1/UbiB family) [Alpinimonas psychrophila]|uniref:Putative unusual protein kinase regulating ubiquinone biosynthesis (AarF/ABC1/UbiB family) n=1 Tax=Alpinimonas psychrophila TaxID=748908 RepID=A0A7W3JUR4_9MICO|nr:putative unusual protein kinase regulating ubiquinone biosynthesis (AarF/ABC1/UbiB family) [Alpinimonas psychrophila]